MTLAALEKLAEAEQQLQSKQLQEFQGYFEEFSKFQGATMKDLQDRCPARDDQLVALEQLQAKRAAENKRVDKIERRRKSMAPTPDVDKMSASHPSEKHGADKVTAKLARVQSSDATAAS